MFYNLNPCFLTNSELIINFIIALSNNASTITPSYMSIIFSLIFIITFINDFSSSVFDTSTGFFFVSFFNLSSFRIIFLSFPCSPTFNIPTFISLLADTSNLFEDCYVAFFLFFLLLHFLTICPKLPQTKLFPLLALFSQSFSTSLLFFSSYSLFLFLFLSLSFSILLFLKCLSGFTTLLYYYLGGHSAAINLLLISLFISLLNTSINSHFLQLLPLTTYLNI